MGLEPSSITGLTVKIRTIHDQVLEGQVFCYDITTNCLVLQSTPSATGSSPINGAPHPTASKKFDFHVLKVNYIKDVTPLDGFPEDDFKDAVDGSKWGDSAEPDELGKDSPTVWSSKARSKKVATLAPVSYVPIDKVLAKEQAAMRAERERLSKIGVGVSEEAQDIFDALTKTMPTSWRGDAIVVLDEIIISAPYVSDSCAAIEGKTVGETSLVRVRKVLEGERKKLGLSNNITTATVNTKTSNYASVLSNSGNTATTKGK